MTSFPVSVRKEIANELDLAIKKIAKKHGLDAKLKGGSYGESTYSPKVEFFSLEGKKEEAQSIAGLFGLPSDIVGKVFKHKTITYTVSGINMKRPKNCVELTGDNGKSYKCSSDQLKGMMNL